MALIKGNALRGCSYNITFYDVDGTTITPAAADTIYCKILREGETAVLTVSSAAATSNGSTFTKGSPNVLRLDAQDLNFDPGLYSVFFELLDDSDTSELKSVERAVFYLESSS